MLKQRIASKCDHPHFTRCDRCILNLLRPHLRKSDGNNLECSHVLQVLKQTKYLFDHGSVVGVAIDGQVQFITQRAEYLLNQYFSPCSPDSLPDSLRCWLNHQLSQLVWDKNVPFPHLSMYVEQAEQQLIIRLIPDRSREQYLLLLEEHKPQSFSIATLELLGLTKREAEVLFWIAKDKSNAGIAKVLGCCEGTVRKHLENLYKKLGVKTRMGAVMVALERLGLIKE